MGFFANLQRSFALALFPSQFVGWIDAVSDALDNSPVTFVLDYVTLEQFGAVGNGVANDQPAYLAALATGKSIILGAKTYLVQGGTFSADGQAIYSFSSRATLKTATNAPVISIAGTINHLLGNFTILGSGAGASQFGVNNGAPGPGDPFLQCCNVIAKNMGAHGFYSAVLNTVKHQGPLFQGCYALSCAGRGFFIDGGSEHGRLQGCFASLCGVGMTFKAGNFEVSGCQIADCTDGIEVSTANNHGGFYGCSITHCTGRILNLHDTDDGCVFSDCVIVFGTLSVRNVDPASALGQIPFLFNGGRIDVAALEFGGDAGGAGTKVGFGTTFRGVDFPNALANTVTNNLGGFPSTTLYYNCQDNKGGPAQIQIDNMTPNVLLGAFSWYRADLTPTMAAARVSDLGDQDVGFGALAQAVGALQPLYSLEGAPALQGDGARYMQSAVHAAIDQPVSAYVVSQNFSSAVGEYILSFKKAAAADTLVLFYKIGVGVALSSTTVEIDSGRAYDTGPQAIIGIFNGANTKLYQNSRAALATGNIGTEKAYQLTIMATNLGAVPMSGNFWECAISTRAWLPSEVDFLMALAKERYNVNLSG